MSCSQRLLVAVSVGLGSLACGGGGPIAIGTTETGADDSTTGATESVEVATEVVRHDTQPMVVDVVVTLSVPGTVTLTHDTDPGVRFASLTPDEPALEHTVRVRGLRPEFDHAISVAAQASAGDSQGSASVEFTTLPALMGHIGAFPVTVSGTAEPVFRLADLSSFTGAQGGVALDADGITRWYWGELPTALGTGGLWNGVALRDDGTVAYTTDSSLEIRDELGGLQASVRAEDIGAHAFHHDTTELPNGNFMILSYEFQPVDYGAEGVLPVFGDVILEVDLDGTIVWEWHAFDHLDPQRRTEGFWNGFPLVDPDTGTLAYDWTHGNALVFTQADDSLLYSSRHQDWILKIDRASGEVVWTLGLDGDFALAGATDWFFHQHSPQWQPDGTLLVYDNAVGNPALPMGQTAHSRAKIYELDETTMVATQVWQDDSDPFVSDIMGDADRMPGGHLLVLDSTIDYLPGDPNFYSRLRELDPDASPMTTWSIETPRGRLMYRASPQTRLVGEARL